MYWFYKVLYGVLFFIKHFQVYCVQNLSDLFQQVVYLHSYIPSGPVCERDRERNGTRGGIHLMPTRTSCRWEQLPLTTVHYHCPLQSPNLTVYYCQWPSSYLFRSDIFLGKVTHIFITVNLLLLLLHLPLQAVCVNSELLSDFCYIVKALLSSKNIALLCQPQLPVTAVLST